GGEWEDWSVARDYVRSLLRRMVNAQQRTVRLQLYGLVQGLSYAVRLNDLKTAQHFRSRLAWALRGPNNLAKPLHGDQASSRPAAAAQHPMPVTLHGTVHLCETPEISGNSVISKELFEISAYGYVTSASVTPLSCKSND